jgi:NRPS condensation-like uncharacterized protein
MGVSVLTKYLGNEITHLHSPNINVCFTARVDRTFTEAEANAAAQALVKRHPSLAYTVKTDADGNRYYDGGGGMEVSVLPSCDLIELYKRIDGEPYVFHKPLVKLYLLNGENSSDIMLIGHHVVADGIGYINLLRDTFSALEGRLPVGTRELPENNAIADGGRGGFLLGLFASGLNKKWAKQGRRFTEEEYYDFFAKYRAEYEPQILQKQIGDDFISRLHKACKDKNITVNEAICEAFSTAIFETQKRVSLRVGVAASIRSEMKTPAHNALGNFTTGVSVTVANSDEATEKIRRRLNAPKYRYQAVRLISALARPLTESVMYAAYGGFDAPVSRKLANVLGECAGDKSAGFSNLGIQQFKDYSFNVSDARFICPAFPQNFLTAGVMTIDNVLTFCLRYNTPETSHEEIEEIYDKASKHLRKTAGKGK